jgi:predicted  nucleic acid-binding Zn-ribbon protein
MSAETEPGAGPRSGDEEDRARGLAALAGLWAVQQIDVRLAEARGRRAALDDGSALRANVEAAGAAAEDAAARLHRAQAALRDHELQLASTEARRKKAERDLYAGRIANPKELAGLQDDIASLARTQDRLEDEILALLDQVEALTGETTGARAAHRALEERWSSHVAEFEAARSRLDAEIADLVATRASLASRVEPRFLRKYEDIIAQEGGSGVGMVAIRAGFCGACGNTVPPQFVSRIRDGRLVTCERCHRILYLDGTP